MKANMPIFSDITGHVNFYKVNFPLTDSKARTLGGPQQQEKAGFFTPLHWRQTWLLVYPVLQTHVPTSDPFL